MRTTLQMSKKHHHPIYVARWNARMEQSELADLCGFTQPKISLLERGKYEPAFADIAAIAKATDHDPRDLCAQLFDLHLAREVVEA